MPLCQIDLLGGLRVTSAGGVITRFRTQKTASLLGYLAFHSPHAYPRDHLVDLFWPEGSPELGRRSLRTALSSLRHQLEPPGVAPGSILVCDRSSVGLSAAGVATDVALFLDALRRAASAASPDEKAPGWASAVDLYRGPLLEGQWEDWLVVERQRMASRFFDATAGLVTYYEAVGDHASAHEYACLALREDPLREEAHRDVLRIYIQSGQNQAALEHYRKWEHTLRRELDTVPTAETRALIEGICPNGSPSAAPARRAVRASGGSSTPPASQPGRLGGAALHADILSFPYHLDAATSVVGDTITLVVAGAAAPDRRSSRPKGLLAGHRARIAGLLEQHHGRMLHGTGESLTAAFASATDALGFAVALQAAMARCRLASGPTGLARVAIHTGDAARALSPDNVGDPSWVGLHGVHQAAGRILHAARIGHILCSEVTAAILHRHLDPAARLVDLGVHRLAGSPAPERLFAVRHAALPEASEPPLEADAVRAGHLPAQVTRFFGREGEAADLRRLLLAPEARLVTLTGLGGSGKTRLALEVARQLLDDLGGAVWFVPLAHLTDARSIPDAVLDAFGLRSPGRGSLEQVVSAVAGAPALVLLDNLEQMGEEGGKAVADLLARAGTLTCLVTSRRALGVPGERLFPVGPLPVPGGEETPEALVANPSVRLFVDRAQAVRPDFQVTLANAKALASLCARLDGIPLALELVAVRAGVLTPSQMLAHLDQCLDWQPVQTRAADSRHRSMRAAMDWSYRLLSPDAQRFFECLTVFRGGWNLDAARALYRTDGASDGRRPLECLSELREHSLVLTEERHGEIRFRMPETLRDYGRERLVERGEAEAVGKCHAGYFLALAEEMGSRLQGIERQKCLNRLDLEHDNLRAALAWYAATEPVLKGRLAGALGLFWEIRGHSSEGRRWLDAVLARGTDLPDPVRSKVLYGAARLAWYQGDFGRAGELLQELLAMHRRTGHSGRLAATLVALGDVSHRRCRLDEACDLFREALGIYRGAGDLPGVAASLYRLGMALCDAGDYPAAVAALEDALSTAQAAGERAIISAAKSMLGQAFYRLGRLDEARVCVRDALTLAQEVDDLWSIVFAQWSLGNMALVEGDLPTATAAFHDGMPRLVALGNKWAVAYGLEAFGGLAAASGQCDRAARLLAAAAALREDIGAPLPPIHRPSLEHAIAGLGMALGASFDRVWAEGRAMSWEQAARYAVEGQST